MRFSDDGKLFALFIPYDLDNNKREQFQIYYVNDGKEGLIDLIKKISENNFDIQYPASENACKKHSILPNIVDEFQPQKNKQETDSDEDPVACGITFIKEFKFDSSN